MLDFTAIDFETANKYANSACSLAAVTMNDDRCVKEGYTLIQPPFMVFDPVNIQIHGITPDQVAHKPSSMPCGTASTLIWKDASWSPTMPSSIRGSCAVF